MNSDSNIIFQAIFLSIFLLCITAGDCGKVNEKFLVVSSSLEYINGR